MGQVNIDILKSEYGGYPDSLTIAFEGIVLCVDTVDFFGTIVTNSVDLTIINDKQDFYELDDLFTGTDHQYKIKIYKDDFVFFHGFIPCAVVEQVWLHKGEITLSATTNLNRLEEYIPTLFEVKGTYSILTVLFHILSYTNLDLPIYINCSLCEQTQSSGYPAFWQIYNETDLFYSDSTTIKDCKTILEYILAPFDCCIYYYNEGWYIERWKDMKGYAETKLYHKFTSPSILDISYIEEPLGESLYPVIGADLISIERSQRIKHTPGIKKVEVTQNETLKLNLVDYYYDDIQLNSSMSEIEQINPNFQYWESLDDSDINIVTGHYLEKMTNYVKISNNWIDPEYDWGPVIWVYTGSSNLYDKLRRSATGMYAKFKIKMNDIDSTNPSDDVTTSINISFSVKFSDSFIETRGTHIKQYPTLYIFWIRFFLRFDDNGTCKWVKYNDSESQYEMVTQADIASYGYDMPIIKVPFYYENFTNKDTFYYEFSTSIALGNTVHNVVGDTPEFILGIIQLGYTNKQFSWESVLPNYVLKESIFGDIYVTANTEVDDNVITGEITDDFVTTEEDTLYMYDSINFSISNGLYLNENKDHTTAWNDIFNRDINIPLIQHFIQDRFQIYHSVRKNIISDFKYYGFLKPFQMVAGNVNGDKIFCVNGYRYILDSDIYEDLTLMEYVNDEGIS